MHYEKMKQRKKDTPVKEEPPIGTSLGGDPFLALTLEPDVPGREFRRFRKPPRPADVGFQISETDGMKVLESQGDNTCAMVRIEAPVLENEILQLMTLSQKYNRQKGFIPSVQRLKEGFPKVAKFCDDRQIEALASANAGDKNPRWETISILSEILQLPVSTIERYMRSPSKRRL